MVLTDDNFASIVKAIEEGRGIYDNIRKYLIYLLSTNSGELLTMFAGVMFAGLLGLVSAEPGLFLPLLAAQLLWINLITDGPPALALGIDPKDPDVMQRQPRPRGSGVLTDGRLDPPRRRRPGDDGRNARRARRLLSGRAVHAVRHGHRPERGRRGLRAHDGVHDADDVPAVRRVQLPFPSAQRASADSSRTNGCWSRSRSRSVTHVLVIYVPSCRRRSTPCRCR